MYFELNSVSLDTAPGWFTRAIATAGQPCTVEVNGVAIHYLSWGLEQRSKPALVFVHGYRAHARWWDFIVPFFIEHYRVVALDLSGMGDSAPRDTYSADVFVDDILGVIDDAQLDRVTLIGHSFGGARVLGVCARAPWQVQQAIVIDSYVRAMSDPKPDVPMPRQVAEPYPDIASALARFHLTPEQPAVEPFILDYIRRHSLRKVEGGWDWKFDRRLPGIVDPGGLYDQLSHCKIPVDVIQGEFSAVVDFEMAQCLIEQLPNGRGPIVIPDGHHHIMLAQPLALISTLRALLA